MYTLVYNNLTEKREIGVSAGLYGNMAMEGCSVLPET